MKKIVLLNPTNNIPYGLMYIASYLRKHGIKCTISSSLIQTINARPDIVGISSMFNEDEAKILKWCKAIKATTKARVILGGNHASTFAERLILHPHVDNIIVGEGEEAFLDICTKNTEKIVRRSFLDIDDIPMPAYDLIDIKQYIKTNNPYSIKSKALPIISSRGCPNACIYCSIGAVWGRTWRGRNPKLVVDEIEYLQKTYGVHEYSFFDDSMSIDKKRLEAICQEIIKRKLKIKWTTPNGIAHWTLDDRLLLSMKESGCYRITIGIETGNPSLRKYIGKPYSLEQASGLIKYANKIGMWTIITIIMGLPYETEDKFRDTLNYTIKCDADFACFYQLIPHPGTKLIEDIDKVVISKDRLDKLQRIAYRKFLSSRILTAVPRLFRKVRNIEDFFYMIKLVCLGVRIMFRAFKKKGHVLYG